ncbi:MAG: thioredoxin domain-containing protein [Pyrinomonadaceae bacterium]
MLKIFMFARSLTGAILLFFFLASIANGQVEESGADDPIRFGELSSATTIEVFIDFQCPSCAALYPKLKAVAGKPSKGVSVIFRHIPLSIHDKAMIAAQAVEAARKQGKAVQMVDIILTNQHLWSNSPKTKTFSAYARKLGLDLERYDEDFQSEATRERIENDIARARFLNIQSTPTVYLNGRQLTFAEAHDIESLVLQGH